MPLAVGGGEGIAATPKTHWAGIAMVCAFFLPSLFPLFLTPLRRADVSGLCAQRIFVSTDLFSSCFAAFGGILYG